MTRYSTMFERLDASGEGAFGAFLMLGDPALAASTDMLDALALGGADMIEVGIPFSDPIADGPVIHAAASRALTAGVKVDDCFRLLAEFRQRHAAVPVGILTYANLLAARGRERFCADAAMAGVDSLLVADVPAIEAEPYAAAARASGIDFVMIAAPNTPGTTLARIAHLCTGYTYCVARTGVTGVRNELSLEHERLFTELKYLQAPLPVLGFGISTPDHVRRAMTAGAAGVISGSAIVRLAAETRSPERVASFVAAMKIATHSDPKEDIVAMHAKQKASGRQPC